jgi:hypothetical protein
MHSRWYSECPGLPCAALWGVTRAGGGASIAQRPRLASIEHGLRERGAGAGQVIGGDHDLHTPKVVVKATLMFDVGPGKLPSQLAGAAGLRSLRGRRTGRVAVL